MIETTPTPTALAVAAAYHEAWTGNDLDAAMRYVADDITCEAPGRLINGAQDYRQFLGGFLHVFREAVMIAAHGDERTAQLTYYVATATTTGVPTAECFTVADGRIVASVLVFDRPSFAPPQA
jgi:ketosteroid isomerase-like protein